MAKKPIEPATDVALLPPPAGESPLPPPAEGGSYVIENGVRRRVEEPTQDHPEGNTNRNSAGQAVDHRGQPIAAAAKE